MFVSLEKGSSKSVFNLGEITRLMKYPGVAKTFTVKIISGLPTGIFQVMFSIISMNFFSTSGRAEWLFDGLLWHCTNGDPRCCNWAPFF